MIAESVYILCMLASTLCAAMLYRKYKQTRTRLLLWSCACFVGLAFNNAVLFVDMIVLPNLDLSVVRLIPALAGVAALLYGFVWDSA